MVGVFAFALALIHGLNIAVRWWQGQPLLTWEYPFLMAFPVLLLIFVTRFSIFRKDCEKCRVDNRD